MSDRPRAPDIMDVASGASLAITDSPDLDEMLSVVARRVAEALSVWECDIDELRPESDALVATALWSPELSARDRGWLGTVYPVAERPSYRGLLRERAVREYQVDDPSLGAADAEIMRRQGELSVLSVPLIFQDDVIGALTLIEKRAPRRFSPDDLRLLEILAVPAAVAAHNARMFRREAQQNRRLSLLLESTRAISIGVDLDEVLAITARTTAEALGAEQCQIQEHDAGANTVTPVAFWQRHVERPEPDSMHKTFSLVNQPEERAFLEAKAVVQQQYSDSELADTTRAIMDKYGDLSYLNVPLVFGDQSFGVMVLVETGVERRGSDEDVTVARALGEQAAAAIEHTRLYRRVQDQANTDGLTGLLDHRCLYQQLEQEIARARRYGTPVSLLMIDLDDLKAFNDRHGHLAGDAAAPPVPGHRRGAEEVVEHIHARVAAAHSTRSDGSKLTSLTMSIGVAVFPHKISSPEDLVGSADAALYKAKRAGKDRVETYG